MIEKKIMALVMLGASVSVSSAVADSIGYQQPDYDRERRLVSEVEDNLFDGEIVSLISATEKNREFTTVITESEMEAVKGTVVILHGRGFHADWQDTIQPLRSGLLEFGWHTVSVQMPVLPKDTTYYQYLPIFPFAHGRIEAALHWAKNNHAGPVVLIAHSCGAHMANDWLNQKTDVTNLLDGYVTLGLGATDYRQEIKTPFPFDNLTVPILDLWGSEEYPRAKATVAQRKRLLTVNANPGSRQEELLGADHYFKDKGDDLTEAVGHWLNQTKF